MAKYIIHDINLMRAANKAQEEVFSAFLDLGRYTIEDDADLTALRDFAQDAINKAMAAHPRCSLIKVSLGEDYRGDYSLTFHAGNVEGYIGSLKIVKINNNWKNK